MSLTEPSIIFKGVGSYLPEKVMTNHDLEKLVDTSDECIVTRTGISERRIAAEGETTSAMAVEAAKKAILNAGLEPKDIDLVIVGTMTPDYPFPATACIVQDKLGLRAIPAFDVSGACAGFCYCLEVASKMMLAGEYKHVLVIGSEKMSGILDWEDRATCVLFGDGAGAAVLGKTDKPNVGILGTMMGTDGKYLKLLYQPGGGSAQPITPDTLSARMNCLKMNGRELFKVVVRRLEQAMQELLDRYNIEPSDIACLIPHQANLRIVIALSQRFGIPMEKFFINLDRYGNTSAASIPIALDEAVTAKRIKSGDLVLLVSFGAGLTWGATLIQWH